MQKSLVGLWVKKFIFFNFKFAEAKFLHNCFWYNLIVYKRADTGNNRKIVNFTYSCLYAMPIKVGPNPTVALQSSPQNPFAPKLGPNSLNWKFLAHTLLYRFYIKIWL